jgi:DNA processing protein
METQELQYWIGFSLIRGIGRAKVSLLLDYFGDLEAAWSAPGDRLRAAGLDRRSVDAIMARRSEISPTDEETKLQQYGVKALTWKDPSYPHRLKEIDSYPPVLYVRGTLLPEDECCIAVVGTRRASAYGRQATQELCGDLARNGITVISGLARGVDTVAHEATLQAGGRTIAVSACGLDMVYPSSNADLARRIMDQGALVSEFPLGARPRAEHLSPLIRPPSRTERSLLSPGTSFLPPARARTTSYKRARSSFIIALIF